MPRKGVKCSFGWTLVDENIENVERVRLDLKTQRELGCLVGEHVFLEYPWAYAHRDRVLEFAKLPDSPLAPFREKIEAYEADTFLLGYSSARLTSDEFVICLTEKAERLVARRNRNITGAFWHKVIGKVIKTAKPWNSLNSDSEVDETFVRNTRELYEIEIVLPGKLLGLSRVLGDRDSDGSKDSYAQLVNADEKFENIERRCICKAVQTYLQPRENFVQTYPGYPKNAWTQYTYEDTFTSEVCEQGEKEEEQLEGNGDVRSVEKGSTLSKENQEEEKEEGEEEEKEPREKTPLELFLEARSQEMIDVIKYNAVVNLHVDDIESLSQREHEIVKISEVPRFREQVSFADFSLTAKKAVSDVSVHPNLVEHIAISYVTDPIHVWQNEILGKFQARVLLWKLSEPLCPQFTLEDHREIYSVSFCPYSENLVLGGCSTGQLVIWNIKDYPSKQRDDENIKVGTVTRNNLPVFRPIVVSDKQRSHHLPVRKIRWMDAKYRIEPNGKMTKSSISSDVQFLTASADGTVAVWNLPSRLNLLGGIDNDSEELFRPICRLRIGPSEDLGHFTPLCLHLPSIGVLHERGDESSQNTNNFDVRSKERDYMKNLWIGCREGLVKCRLKEQPFEEKSSDIIECEILTRSCVHNGPVAEITQSPHLRDVLLTVGGQVFAIWKDDYMDSPLFWRRTTSRYTTCGWANEPGVFLLGSQEGSLEMWDIKNEPNKPVLSQIVSSKSIVHLTLLQYPLFPGECLKMIGVGDQGGFFRVFKEPKITFRNEDTIERMDWFEEYAWREVRRKNVFVSWQNDFLANDPTALTKRPGRRDEERIRETMEEAREKLRREREARFRLKAEKRARSAPISKDVAWKLKEFDRMKKVLLSKKNFDPVELEAKRLPLVVSKEEREAKLKRAEDRIARREEYFLNALSLEFPQVLERKVEGLEFEESIELGKSVDDYVKKFSEIQHALGIICMACASPAWLSATHWFLFVAVTAFIATLLWCFIYVLSIREALKLPINWILTELLNTTIFTVLYMIAFIAQLSVWSALHGTSTSRNIAAGVFGIFNTVAYAAGAYFLYVEWRNSNAQ